MAPTADQLDPVWEESWWDFLWPCQSTGDMATTATTFALESSRSSIRLRAHLSLSRLKESEGNRTEYGMRSSFLYTHDEHDNYAQYRHLLPDMAPTDLSLEMSVKVLRCRKRDYHARRAAPALRAATTNNANVAATNDDNNYDADLDADNISKSEGDDEGDVISNLLPRNTAFVLGERMDPKAVLFSLPTRDMSYVFARPKT